MKKLMSSRERILVIAALVLIIILFTLLLIVTGPVGSLIEFLGRERLNLTEQRNLEIEQLIETMRRNNRPWPEIQSAVRAKLREWGINPPPPGDIELFYTVKTVISTANAAITTILLIIYLGVYRKTKSNFTAGLIIFSLTLLLYTLASNPLLHWVFGFRAFGLGPFAMLPDLFTFIAVLILLYLSLK
ncbi:MAG: hypothetical protein RMJ07_00895 [Nitrososphaerota archaeon]|nr:hypothetical protein [Candidatus Bathyarchaeota archaeon]MDW8048229.1 hypothetical protein [Nitrososphaerota archaeon]